MRIFTLFILSCGMLISGKASATTYSFFNPDPGGSQGAGDIKNFSAQYNNSTEVLTWSTTIEEVNGNLADGFWMVLSDGDNPKGDANEYAIMYADITTGNVSTYLYNGANSSNSWMTPGEHIHTYAGILGVDDSVADQRSFDFTLDASVVNSHVPAYIPSEAGIWDGINFGPQIGIWFHAVVFSGSGASYIGDELASFQYSSQSWYDDSFKDTSVVPVPTAVWLFGSALVGLVGFSRRKTDI